jgi:hypothetical protein
MDEFEFEAWFEREHGDRPTDNYGRISELERELGRARSYLACEQSDWDLKRAEALKVWQAARGAKGLK